MKIELHCHLDGSLNLYSVQEMLREQGEIYELEELKTQLEVLPECTSLTEYLEKFSLPLNHLINLLNIKPYILHIIASLYSSITKDSFGDRTCA